MGKEEKTCRDCGNLGSNACTACAIAPEPMYWKPKKDAAPVVDGKREFTIEEAYTELKAAFFMLIDEKKALEKEVAELKKGREAVREIFGENSKTLIDECQKTRVLENETFTQQSKITVLKKQLSDAHNIIKNYRKPCAS